MMRETERGGRRGWCLEDKKERASYEPPRLTAISLRPEEAVLSHCKITTAAGPIGVTCGVLIAVCSTVGS
jgi:hypothetical protein